MFDRLSKKNYLIDIEKEIIMKNSSLHSSLSLCLSWSKIAGSSHLLEKGSTESI